MSWRYHAPKPGHDQRDLPFAGDPHGPSASTSPRPASSASTRAENASNSAAWAPSVFCGARVALSCRLPSRPGILPYLRPRGHADVSLPPAARHAPLFGHPVRYTAHLRHICGSNCAISSIAISLSRFVRTSISLLGDGRGRSGRGVLMARAPAANRLRHSPDAIARIETLTAGRASRTTPPTG